MIALLLPFVLLLASQAQSSSPDSPTAIQQRAKEEYERHKQAAIRINDLAERVHSEADADTLVSEIAGVFAKEMPSAWLASGVNERVANAEFHSVRDPAKRVPEQRIVDVWNQYVREIGAPDEALVTAAEIHNLRDGEFTAAQYLWDRGTQTVWTVPNIYAVGSDGKVAESCRAIETVRVIHDLYRFQNLIGARDRARRGIVASEEVKKHMGDSTPHAKTVGHLVVQAEMNPVRSAERRYLQEHGQAEYDQLLKRLFDELFPAE